jgi:hypothetical protein
VSRFRVILVLLLPSGRQLREPKEGGGGRAYRYVRGGSFDFSFRKAAAGFISVDLLFDPPTDLATTRRSVRVVDGSSSHRPVRSDCTTMRVAMSRACCGRVLRQLRGTKGGPRWADQSINREARGAWVVLFRARDRTKRERDRLRMVLLSLLRLASHHHQSDHKFSDGNNKHHANKDPKGASTTTNASRKSEIHPKSEVNIYTYRYDWLRTTSRARLSSFRTTILIRHSQRAYLIRPSVVTQPTVIVILSSSHPRPRPKNHTSYFLVSPQGPPSIRNHIRLVSR